MGNFLSSVLLNANFASWVTFFMCKPSDIPFKKPSPKQMSLFSSTTLSGLRSRNCPVFLQSSTWTDSDPTGESGWVRPVEEVQVDCALPQWRYLQGGGASFFDWGRVLGSDVDKSGRNIFFILQNGSFGKGWQSKVVFLKIYKGNCVVWCLYVCFCIIFFAFTALRNVKQKNDVRKCQGIFRFVINLGLHETFPPQHGTSISRIRSVRLTVWNGSGGTQEIGPGLLTRTAGGSCMKNPWFFYVMYVSNKTWALVHVVGCKISIDKFCWTLIILPNWFVYVHVWSPSQTKVLVERFELHPG